MHSSKLIARSLFALAAVTLWNVLCVLRLGRRVADPMVDFGMQLQLADRLADGEVLYRDVAHFKGPFSPYFNALVARAFGSTLHTLIAANLAVYALVAIALAWLLTRTAGRSASHIAGVFCAGVFGFSSQTLIPNYNFATPYTHEVTHGLAAALLAIVATTKFAAERSVRWAAAAGVGLGVVVLTDPQIAIAASVAIVLALSVATRTVEDPRRRGIVLGAWLAATSAPIVVAWCALARAASSATAWAMLEGWVHTLRGDAMRYVFFREGLGTDDVVANVSLLAQGAAVQVVVLAALGAVALSTRRRGVGEAAVALAAAGGCALVVAWSPPAFLSLVPRTTVLWALGATVWAAARVRRAHEEEPGVAVGRFALSVFALLLLAKMALNARWAHYGFVLAFPATALWIAALVSWIPTAVEARGGSRRIWTAGSLGMLAAAAGIVWVMTGRLNEIRTVPVGEGGDAFLAEPRGGAVQATVQWLRAHTRAEETVVAMPLGAMVNHLARRRNPTPWASFTPMELDWYGEATMVATFARHPPDHIVLVHADMSEFNARFFGRDYGRELFGWIARHYEPEVRFGAVPLRDERFGILVLRRRAVISSPSASSAAMR